VITPFADQTHGVKRSDTTADIGRRRPASPNSEPSERIDWAYEGRDRCRASR
jgi:hypothetical protein